MHLVGTNAINRSEAFVLQALRPLPKLGECLLGYYSSGNDCLKIR